MCGHVVTDYRLELAERRERCAVNSSTGAEKAFRGTEEPTKYIRGGSNIVYKYTFLVRKLLQSLLRLPFATALNMSVPPSVVIV